MKRILNVIFNLKCLHTFSPLVRCELSKVLFFVYYQKGRTILRENHVASTAYFILDGEITVYKRQWDSVRHLINLNY